MRDEIIAHARAETPRECCGLIAGRDGDARHLYRLTNVAPGNVFYEIDPRQLYELEFRELPGRGWEVLAVYHSHPASEAYPSKTDVALAFWPEALYLICSLADPDRPVLRAFHIAGGEIVEAEVGV
jgi:proteasome lid subunit RPN8/RPN11